MTIFIPSDAGNDADRLILKSEQYGEFATDFLEQVIAELQSHIEDRDSNKSEEK
ncbi:MAG: hypothetical protein AAGG48_14735 [Planctomycetota bacterium]